MYGVLSLGAWTKWLHVTRRWPPYTVTTIHRFNRTWLCSWLEVLITVSNFPKWNIFSTKYLWFTVSERHKHLIHQSKAGYCEPHSRSLIQWPFCLAPLIDHVTTLRLSPSRQFTHLVGVRHFRLQPPRELIIICEGAWEKGPIGSYNQIWDLLLSWYFEVW